MSNTIKQAITALKGRIADCYTAVSAKGGTLPATQDSANLPTAIESIPQGAQEFVPDTFTQLTSVTLTSTNTDNNGINIALMTIAKIELTISGTAQSNKQSVIASGGNNTWWIGYTGSETLNTQSITISYYPQYTYSQLYDGNKNTITITPSGNTQSGIIRFFGFNSATYNNARTFYDIKLYAHNDLLISHLVPVRRIADNAIGLYDSVRQLFFDYSSYLSE